MNEIPTIANLRRLAELNFGPQCYKQYKALIEPGIKSIIENYFSGWKNVESTVTQMVMKDKGVFKTELLVIAPISKSEQELVDFEAFNKIDKWPFKRKIKYLHKKNILRDSTFKLLDVLNHKRNTIHVPNKNFSEQDLAAFSYASSIVFYILSTMVTKNPQKLNLDFIKDNAEKSAEYLLSKIFVWNMNSIPLMI